MDPAWFVINQVMYAPPMQKTDSDYGILIYPNGGIPFYGSI